MTVRFKGEDLIERVRKIMPLEPKSETEAQDNKPIKHFTQVEDIVILTLPTKVTRPVSVEVEGKRFPGD